MALAIALGVPATGSAQPIAGGEPPAGPAFSKVFSPSTIGAGSTSTLTFTITNASVTPVSALAFTDVLPMGIALATPASASTTCVDGGVVAADGGGTISLSGGRLGGSGASCTVTVNVIGTTTATNTSGTLSSSAGTGGTASATLTVDPARLGFSKSFVPSSIPLGGVSKLTLTLTNGDEGSKTVVTFTDPLPAGMVIATPANVSNTCSGTVFATPGTSVITLGSGLVGGSSSCTITVDVTTTTTGLFVNTTLEVQSGSSGSEVSGGIATAALDVPIDFLVKSFTDDPVVPGGTATLQFTIQNPDRVNTATAIAFTDPLPTGLTAVAPLSTGTCNGTLTGTTTLSYSGGSLAGGASCSFSVTMTAPATIGTHTNTTAAITATIDGTGVTGNTASDILVVNTAPTLTKLFVGDPVGAGGTVTIRFTVTNTSTTSAATAIAFDDELTESGVPGGTGGFLPFPVTIASPTLPAAACGGTLDLASFGDDRSGLSLTGGSLAAAPGASSSCTFDVTLTIPAGFPGGTYVNTTGAINATVGGTPLSGAPASDDLVVVAPPILSKEFTNDPVDPGDSVTLQFTLTHDALAPGSATAVGFTDDLTTAIAGLTATGLPLTDVCGAGNGTLSGTTSLTFSGATLTPGQVCTFSATLTVPAGASPGSHTNTTGDVTATVLGVTATGNTAKDDLQIKTLTLTKEFTDDPVIAGGTATLRFTLTNQTAVDATGINFTDSLSAILPGTPDVTVSGTLPVAPCGGSLTGTTSLTFSGGTVTAGTACTFDVTLLVPAGTADGTYINTTSNVVSSLGTGDTASDALTVNSTVLQLTKEFTDDPVAPGGSANLRFTLTNLAGSTVSDIGFSDVLTDALAGLSATAAPTNTCGGMGSGFPTGTFAYSGGSLGAGGTCTIDLSVSVPAGAPLGTFTNTTSGVTGTVPGPPGGPAATQGGTGLAVTGTPASDDLRVSIVKFTKAFAGAAVAGGTVTLTFTIDNTASATALTALGFTDNLASVLSGLLPTDLPKNNICGTGSILSETGPGFLTFIGGNLLAAASCVFDVTLQVPSTATAGGTFTNTTSSLLADGLPVVSPATANLKVEPAPTFAKSFAPDPIAFGGTSTLTFTIDNSASALAASSLAFTDSLPAGLVVATPPGATNTCGGVLTATAGASSISLAGGTVAAGTTCTITVAVTGTVGGTVVNTTGDLTSSSGNSGKATDTLTITASLTLTKSFTNDPVAPGGTVTLEFTLSNLDPTQAATAISFIDDVNAALAGVFETSPATTNQCAIVDGANGTGVIPFTLASLPAASSCTFSLTLRIPATAALGLHLNTTSQVTGTIGGIGVTGPAAVDNLRVALPTGVFVFDDDTLELGDTIRAIDINELRTHVNTARTAYGLVPTPYPFTDDPLVVGVTTARAVHLTDLRRALDDVLVLAGIGAQAWVTDPANVVGLVISASDLTQIRTLLNALP